MAIIPRAGAMPAPANVSNTRLGPPTRVISPSSSSSSVEELPGGEGVAFDSAAFSHYDESSSFDRGGNRGQNQNFNQHPGSLNAPTQAFAAMLEAGGPSGTDNSDGTRNEDTPPSPGLVSMVINTYENNAKVVSGEMNILGTSVSMVL